MNIEVITLESDDELHSKSGNNVVGTATAAILNEKPLNINSLLGLSSIHLPVNYNNLATNNANGSTKNYLPKKNQSLPTQNGCLSNDNHCQNQPMPFENAVRLIIGQNITKIAPPPPKISRRQSEDFAVPTTSTVPHDQSTNFVRHRSTGNTNFSLQAKIRRMSEMYMEACGGMHQNAIDDEFPGQFKCTYNGCSKRLRNNVVFMYHLWAHVNRYKPYVEEPVTNLQIMKTFVSPSQSPSEFSKNDMSRLMTCPECLLVQSTPHRMHLHFHRVHKQSKVLQPSELVVCKTCESVYHARSIAEHLQSHGDSDMPYHCRKCRYRASSREAMFHHFSEMHCGSILLLCPFCMYTYTIPQNDKQRNIVVAKPYVQHMMDHDLDIQHGCGQCVTRFSKNAGTDLESRMENHLKQHKEVNERWKIAKKNFSNLVQQQSKLVYSSSQVSACSECFRVLGNQREQRRHFKDLKKCELPNCNFESNCVYATKLHFALSLCRAENTVRWPFGCSSIRSTNRPPSNIDKICATEQFLLRCSGCGLSGTDGDAMCRHLVAASNSCNSNATQLNSLMQNNTKVCANSETNSCANAVVYTERVNLYHHLRKTRISDLNSKVIEIFGLDRMLDINPVKDFIKTEDVSLTTTLAVKSETNEVKEDFEDETNEDKLKNYYYAGYGVDEITQKLANMLPLAKIAKVKEDPLMTKYLLEPCDGKLDYAGELLNITEDIRNFELLKNYEYPISFFGDTEQNSWLQKD